MPAAVQLTAGEQFGQALAWLQAASFGCLKPSKAELGIWEALQLGDTLCKQRTGSVPSVSSQHMSFSEHAIQTAELCRLTSPQQDWLHLAGLIHGLGKLMALPRYCSRA